MKILVIEDDPSVNLFLREVAKAAGHETASAETGEQGLQRYADFAPDLILADVHLPDIDGLKVLEKIRRRNSDVIFIVVTGLGSVDIAVRALQLKANNFLHKPVRVELIKSLLQKYDQRLKVTHLRGEVSRMVVRRDLRMVLPSRLEIIGSAVEVLVREAAPWLNEQEQFGIQLGLHELLTNAVEHGNLAITYEEKHRALSEGPHQFQQLVERRMVHPIYGQRQVTVEFNQTNDRLDWVIQDEGDGFDWAGVPSPLDSENQERLNGRGIFLARFQFDALEYIGNGNKVRVSRQVPAPTDVTPDPDKIAV
ncbi:response regulator [Candidatus Sumerlaeota bacterium]|nr:response regulator [Candidatus Sumerlaeota bacterium]